MARGNYGANGGTGRQGSHSFGNSTDIVGWYEDITVRKGLMNYRSQAASGFGRTISEISLLDKKDRVTELARMLGGQGEAARKHAEVLLQANA